jgi:hypothetical protein
MKTIAKLMTFWSFVLTAICVSAAAPQATDFSQRSKPATVKVLLHRQLQRLFWKPKAGMRSTIRSMKRKFPRN